ncbi:MAG TPA: hypothetical protein VEX86_22055 [Longimicrobium sp.]|nr:hypothetical protein [Longimicrobium sp.]
MIQESVREMNAEERVWLQKAMQPHPPGVGHSDESRETWGLAAVWILTMVVVTVFGRVNIGGIVAAGALGAILVGYRLVRAAARNAQRRKFFEQRDAHRNRELARVLEDGRVTVKRVRAVAVVEIEPVEDEGTGYVFDLGDGRVLFIKGDYFPADIDAPWPNTAFEIVRTAADGEILDVRCHGTALPPLRVVPRNDVDPATGWDAREEVLHMSLDDAVRTVLRKP